MIDDTHEHASLTRKQIDILRGRKPADLSPREKLDYANFAARPLPAVPTVPEHFKFAIDLDKIADAPPLRKLQVADGAPRMGRIRQEIARLASEIASEPDPITKVSLEHARSRKQREGAELYALIGPYEQKSNARH